MCTWLILDLLTTAAASTVRTAATDMPMPISHSFHRSSSFGAHTDMQGSPTPFIPTETVVLPPLPIPPGAPGTMQSTDDTVETIGSTGVSNLGSLCLVVVRYTLGFDAPHAPCASVLTSAVG